MSTENAKISRTLVVDTPLTLWKICKNNCEILSNEILIQFIYFVDLYVDGCKCDDVENRKLVSELFDKIKSSSDILNFLMATLRCKDIIFLDSENW